jgi:glutathione synthase/RimK-type ligase-like ATP-grasp enzyme
MVSWRDQSVDWNQYEVVIIRSPWDYQDDPEAFIEVLEQIDQSDARLENALSVVEWNLRKTYLRDLESQGVPIVPTLWPDAFHVDQIDSFFEQLETDQIVLKPVVGANADHTYWIRPADIQNPDVMKQLVHSFTHRPYMVQPFMPAIVDEGEFSLFYFGDTYSHAILKTPKSHDFRVQEEHGGRLQTVTSTPEMQRISEQILEALPHPTLYARIDLVRDLRDFSPRKPTPEPRPEQYCVMEVELIEPSLYFNMDKQSPERFAKVLNSWLDS